MCLHVFKQRSALAYRNDSSPDTGFRINVGISTTSTTSQSSKSTGRYRPPHYKDDDFGRSTSSSTSGHVPSGSTYPHNTGIAPYGYEPSAGDALPEEECEFSILQGFVDILGLLKFSCQNFQQYKQHNY